VSVLPDHEIRGFCSGDVVEALIRPFNEEQLQPASYDVLLGTTVLVPKRHGKVLSTALEDNVIDLGEPIPDDLMFESYIGDVGHILFPGQFVLGATVEYVCVPPWMVGRIEGKSSLARVGQQIHSAGYLDPGFRGNVTLELVNFMPRPVRLRAGMKIGQLSFDMMISKAERPYGSPDLGSHYQDSKGAIPSRFGKSGT